MWMYRYYRLSNLITLVALALSGCATDASCGRITGSVCLAVPPAVPVSEEIAR